MYENFFGLSCLPFEDRIQLEFLFTNPDLEEVLASMECELRYRQGLGFVVGESGTGKTLLVRSLLTKLDPQDPAIIVKCPDDGRIDIIRETCKGFGVTLPSQFNAKRGLARLRRRLEDARQLDRLPVLIIDQAENLSVEAMAALESLIDLGRDDNRLLTMLLVGQPRTIDMLGQPRFDRLRQQLSSELRLHKFTSAQTCDYINHRLRIAGAGDKEIFDPAAIAVIHIVTHGVPRLINRLADASMVAAYSANQLCVTAELVREMSAQQSQKSKPSRSIVSAVQENDQMSKLVSRIDSTIQSLKGDDINVAIPSHQDDGSTNVSERARSLITRLEQTLRQSEKSTTKLEQRAKTMVVEVQDQLNELENETMRVSGVTTEVQPQLQRIENTCDRAVKVEAQLSAFAETLVERADSVQQRISLLMTAMTDADACRENIHATTHQAAELVEQSQQTSHVIQESLDQVRRELKESKRGNHEAVESLRKQFNHIGEDAQRQYVSVIEKEKTQLARSLGVVVNESIAEFKASLTKLTQDALDEQREATKQMTKEFAAVMESAWAKTRTDATRDVEKISVMKVETFRHNVETISKELAETVENNATQTRHEVSKLQEKAAGVLQATQQQLEQLSQQHVDQENKYKSLLEKRVDLDTQLDDLSSKAKSTQHLVQDAQTTVVAIQRDSQDTITGLSTALDRGQAMTTDVDNACGRVESLQRSISNMLLEVGGAYERLNTLSEKAVRVEQISGNLENIESLVNRANKAVDLLQPAVTAADEKAGRLQSHHAAATSLLNKLSKANVDGQTVVQQVERASTNAKQLVEMTTEKIDRMIKDVWGLTTKAEAASKDVSQTITTVQPVNPTQDGPPETQTVNTQNKNDEQAEPRINDVALRTEAYAKLTDQVNSITKVLSKAQEVATSTREEMAKAAEIYDNLTTISDVAGKQITNLGTLIHAAGDVVETHEQLQFNTDSAKQDIQQHLAAIADTTDAGKQMIGEFTRQAIDIEKQLRVATRKSAQLQSNVAEALAQPGEIVTAAKEQAAQLEQVCTAVRKVFSALSKSSLEAQEKIKVFNDSSAEAKADMTKLKNTTIQVSERIQSITKSSLGNLQATAKQSVEHIRSESSRASETLSEWVQETKRAQQRLEHALQHVPSISQTHPIKTASQAVRPIPTPVLEDYETGMTPVSGLGLIAEKQASVESVTLQGDDQANRKAKIKKLLEEARRVSVSARS